MREWEAFLNEMAPELGDESIERWLKPLKVLRFDAQNLHLEAPTPLHQSWFEEQVRPFLSRFTNGSGRPIRVHFFKPSQPRGISHASGGSLGEPLDPQQTFDTFLPHPGVALAHTLLQQPLQDNPIVLFGPKHAGKTHLLMALAAALQSQGKKALYVRAERFTEHVVHAIHTHNMADFRNLYRDVDALLVDNLEILARKTATQEEFFHTFNTLHINKRPLILSCNVPPSRLTDIEPRLISRFEWGLTLPLTPPTPPQIAQILLKKAAALSYPLTPAQATELATRFPHNPYQALTTLILRAPKGPPTPLDPILRDLLLREEEAAITPTRLIDATARHFGLKPEDLLGKSQTRECTYPRQIAMYLLRTQLSLPLQAIGRLFSRDHSTVLTSVRAIEKRTPEEALTRSLDAISNAVSHSK